VRVNNMTDDVKQPDSGDATAGNIAAGSTEPQKSGSPLIKYVLFGVGGLALTVAVAFGVLLLLGEGEPTETEPLAEESVVADGAATEQHVSDHLSDAEKILSEALGGLPSDDVDPTAMETILQSLEYLDYQPDESELESELDHGGISKEDSTEFVRWIEEEKARLAQKESVLDKRESELKGQHRDLDRKLLTLEKAESSRINQLAKLYDGMDAQSVARLMASLDDETVVSIMPRMKLKNASTVLSLMPSQRAARLSKRMITIAEK